MNNLTPDSMEMLRMGFTQVAFWNGTPSCGKCCIPGDSWGAGEQDLV